MNGLAAEGLAVSLDRREVLRDVDLAVAPGEIVGVVGPNGAGKTTLLRALAGLLPPGRGRVTLDGGDLGEIAAADRARAIAFLAQDRESRWPLTAETVVGLGRLPHRGPWRGPLVGDRAAVARALADCDVAHLVGRPVDRLSGGERARVLLARALAVEPRFLLADEPTAGLDPAQGLAVMARLAALAAAGAGIVIVVHDLTVAARYCARLVLLRAGRIVASGAAAEVLSPANLAAHYGITAHAGTAGGRPFVVPLDCAEEGTGG